MGCNPTVDYGSHCPPKMNSGKNLFYCVAAVYFKVAVPNPGAHSVKEIRLHQINDFGYLDFNPTLVNRRDD
jgi:hypothetical protein